MQLSEYWLNVAEALSVNPGWRAGQAAFNVLRTWRPDLAEQIVGSDLDPFYLPDGEVPTTRAFRVWLKANWGAKA